MHVYLTKTSSFVRWVTDERDMFFHFGCGELEIGHLISLRTILPRLPIRAKLLIAFAGLSVLPVLCVSIYGIWVNVRTMERIALGDLSHDVSTIRGRTADFLSDVESDLRLLGNSTHVREFGRAVEHGSTRATETALHDAAEEFLSFASTKGLYYQICLMDTTGAELLRIQSALAGDSVVSLRNIAPPELRHFGGTYYRVLTAGLGPGQIAVAPAELISDDSTRVPVLSFAVPEFGPTRRAGILVAQVFARRLFDALEIRGNQSLEAKVVLVGSDGHYLYNSDERGNWNRLIAEREEDNLQKDYPASIAAAVISGGEGVVTDGADDIIAYAPLLAPRQNDVSRVAVPGLTETLHLFERVPRSAITREARSSAYMLTGFLVVFFGGAIGLGLLATREFTRPISEVRRGAEVISRGNYGHRLVVDTGDEIESLASQFNIMAASLEDHEREIEQHRTQLEEMVKHRTSELVEEKGKLQAILDNVPNAFVMLDRTYRIQSASAAFTSVTGLSLEAVTGKDIRQVFHEVGLCRRDREGDALHQNGYESHIDRIPDPTGNDRFLEHISIPIQEKGETVSILQILSDVTARRRLEEHLIQSEKLMATGEMAAIIAHGFRNSLTSIKMILQLQQESAHVGSGARKAMRVALDSISRMEAVVQELLNFARPTPMQFDRQDLNALIEESLTLVGPRIKSLGIALTRNLDTSIPAMEIDGTHMREALINILLNALQAIEGKSSPRSGGAITVTTSVMKLPRTLRDFRGADQNGPGGGQPAAGGREIVLRKGSPCAVVRISDDGPGIDAGALGRIFDPFFTTKTNGTGLGLPMVKRAVNAHGGIVTVKTSRLKGTSFEIVLPVHDNPSSDPLRTS